MIFVPRLWTETIKTHRREVREAILDATAALVVNRGALSVSMSQIAEAAGISRATLYKYFLDVEAIMIAWHQRHIADHMRELTQLRDQADSPGEQLAAVLHAYAVMSSEQAGSELSVLMHRDEHVVQARERLRDFIRALLVKAARSGDVRDDVAPEELASYCLSALQTASDLRDDAAIRRRVALTLAGLRRPLRVQDSGLFSSSRAPQRLFALGSQQRRYRPDKLSYKM
jgi:AcrR family transcriptional regulator